MNQYIFFLLYGVLCVLVAFLGRNRKWGYWGYLWASVIFSPLMGLLFVLAADPKQKESKDLKKRDEHAEVK